MLTLKRSLGVEAGEYQSVMITPPKGSAESSGMKETVSSEARQSRLLTPMPPPPEPSLLEVWSPPKSPPPPKMLVGSWYRGLESPGIRSLGYFSSIGTSEQAARVPSVSKAATARAQRNQKTVRLADGLDITGFSSNRPLGWASGIGSRAALNGRNKQNSCCGSSLAAALRQAGAAGG